MLTTLTHFFAFLPDMLQLPAVVVSLVVLAFLALKLAFRFALWIIGRMLSEVVRTAAQARKLAHIMTGFTALGVSIPLSFEAVIGTVLGAL